MKTHAQPEQWKGELDDGERFYAWCRYGVAKLEIPPGKPVAQMKYANPLQGYFEEGDLKKLFAQADIDLDENLLTTGTSA